MTYDVAIDVGGTFTDLVAYCPDTGRQYVVKAPTTADPTEGVVNSLDQLCARHRIRKTEIVSVRYGTTAAVNALVTRRGARVGVITTKGFSQLLHLARSQTPGPLVGWLNWRKPEPLADLELTREVEERVRADGTIETALDERSAETAVRELCDAGVEAIAVVCLHSYANARHEKRVVEITHELAPELPVVASSAVRPEYREYERAVTTVANAYITPAVAAHLGKLDVRLREADYRANVSVVRSDGGIMSVRAATAAPLATVYSGPSGGVAAALAAASQGGFQDVLTLDMGGTSTDVSVCRDGNAVLSRETVVDGVPLLERSVDVRSIGTGGGSVAYVPGSVRGLRVGPRSAGADPGPVCYGKGGAEPTVTDADVVLGRVPSSLLGGEMVLDVDAANRAIGKLGASLDLGVVDAAAGIVEIVDEQMAGALRVMSVERGLDPRSFALVAFGGAGPVHANALAARLGCYPVVVPPNAGVLSAAGFHALAVRNSFSRSLILALNEVNVPAINAAYDALMLVAEQWMTAEGVSTVQLGLACDLRFLRQGYEIEVSLEPEERRESDMARLLTRRFVELHRRLYDFVPSAPIEVVNIRVSAVDTAARPHARTSARENPGTLPARATQTAYLDGRWQPVAVHERRALAPGTTIDGPAIITQLDSTTLVLPRHYMEVDDSLNLWIRPMPRSE